MDANENDPDRHLKKIQKIVGVSNRIQSMAAKRKQSIKLETKEEREERILVNFFKAFLKFFRISFITENRKKRTS
jgi:hypothetical protein